MEHISPMQTRDFLWQMCMANGTLDFEKFRNYECVKQQQKLVAEYGKYLNDPMNQEVIDYWAEAGVKKFYYPEDLDSCKDIHDSHVYSILGPINPEEGKKYPVVYFSHGGGAIYFDTEMYGLAENIQKDPFYLVCPNIYGSKEFDRIIDAMMANGFPIDESRIYAMGFSGGSGSTADVAIGSPKRVAGVALIPGSNAINQVHMDHLSEDFDKYPEMSVATIFVGGMADGGDHWPLVDRISFNNFNAWMDQVCKVTDLAPITKELSDELIATTNDNIEKFFGLHFHHTYMEEIDGLYVYVADNMNADGTAGARFVSIENYPHGVFPIFFAIAWAYLSKFKKNPETFKSECKVNKIDFRTWRSVDGEELEHGF